MCQSSINRLFTSAVPNPTDDLFFTLWVLDILSRAEFCRSALWLISGGDARTRPGGEAAGSMFEEGISGREVSANPSSSPLPSPAVFLSPELELLASTLRALEGLALSKRSFSVCGAFGWHSWNASTRAEKATVPKTPVASQIVLRLNLLIVSLFTGGPWRFGAAISKSMLA